MSKTLIIAEKPDMAKSIAAALNIPKSKGCYENEQFIVSNCIGHLIEFDVPEWCDKNAKLPVIPNTFSLKVKENTAKHYEFLRGLIHRTDVSVLVNACDADRAGEHIFRLVYQHSGSRKPVKRMWIQSTTKQGLQQAFNCLQDSAEYDNLAHSEQCRAEADWLLGLNGSRAVGNQMGRVMTPTLAMVVDAHHAHTHFQPENYWEVSAQFQSSMGGYSAKLLDADGKVARFESADNAQAACQRIKQYGSFTVRDEAKTELSHAPFLFDANELQKAANKKFGYSADKTLSIMQKLYQDFRALTYPRSDFNALPTDYRIKLGEALGGLGQLPEYKDIISDMVTHNIAQTGIKHPDFTPEIDTYALLLQENPRVFDDARVGSHYAIVPTGFVYSAADDVELYYGELSPNELQNIIGNEAFNIFNLVVLRTLAALYPAAEYAVTTRITQSGDDVFRTSGRVLQQQGWLKVYGGTDENTKDTDMPIKLPALQPNETVVAHDVVAQKLTTKAPPLMTESGLIQAMKTAGRNLDDKHLANLMQEIKGIGTSATRAPIIKKLKDTSGNGNEAYIFLDKNKLIPSQRAIDAIAHIRRYFPEIADPILTAEWEDKLHQIEQGKLSPDDFRVEIHGLVRRFVETVLPHRPNFHEKESLCLCPNCRSGSLNSQKFSWTCTECGFKLHKETFGRTMSNDELKQLAETGETDLLQGFISKGKGTQYAATLKLIRDDTGALGMKLAFPEHKTGICPCCSGSLNGKNKLYECTCGFKLWKTIAGKTLTEAQIKTLLEKGITGEIKGFVGKSGKPFNAKLMINRKAKKVEFQFNH